MTDIESDVDRYDYIVIGAGIHGAGVAQAASAAGYRVLLLEQYAQPAMATSSRSSKLIHGGLRYLENAQFALVRECLRERGYLLNNAPQLVTLKHFYIPVYKTTTRRPWKIALGLALYSLFSWRRFYRVKRDLWGKLDGLNTQDLEAVFSYYDAQTDDARLTHAVLASAESLGTRAIFNCTVQKAVADAEGTVVQCQTEQSSQSFRARIVVNASGPWVADMHARLCEAAPLMVSLVQGAHIVLPGQVTQPFYLESPSDQRAVFVLPWKDNILVGTTETAFEGNPAKASATAAEIEYLLEIYNHYFKQSYTTDDVIEAFAGLRVLPAGEGAAFSRSRDTVFVRDDEARPRVVSILGGKLTAYRATAEKLVNSLKPFLPPTRAIADTARLPLPSID
jgi:glycerol-3-phosphate dehydrogenase